VTALLALGRGALERPGYDLLLVVHVLAALVGFGAVATSAWHARALHPGASPEARKAAQRFFRPGLNLPARVVYVVPASGVGLVVQSGGHFGFEDGFVVAGLLGWVVAVGLLEVVAWPAERRIAEELGRAAGTGDRVADATTSAHERVASGELARLGLRLERGATAAVLLAIAVAVTMFLRP
jgi:hypothetical protein